MENGDGSVTMKVSGPLRDQVLFVDIWDILINLVSQMCPKTNKILLLSIIIKTNCRTLIRTGKRDFSGWFRKSSHSE